MAQSSVSYAEDDDDDIDISYDWNARTVKTKPAVDKRMKSTDDSDIDASYDWTGKKLAMVLMPSTDGSELNIDSNAMLQTPSYSKNDHDPNAYALISKLNLLTNKYSESMTEGPESPISLLSQQEENCVTCTSFKPSQRAKLMKSISELEFDENDDADDDDDQKVNEKSKNEDCINIIDTALGEYYKNMGANGYFDQNGKGKFMKYCLRKQISNKQVSDAFESEPMECIFLDFDENFPFKVVNTINDDEEVDDLMKENLRKMEIFTLLKYCYDNGESPY